MVLKRNRGLSLDIGSRYERAEHKTHNSSLIVTLVLLDRDWGRARRGLSRPPRQKVSVTSHQSSSTRGGGLNPQLPLPPTNQTLVVTRDLFWDFV